MTFDVIDASGREGGSEGGRTEGGRGGGEDVVSTLEVPEGLVLPVVALSHARSWEVRG